MDGPSPIWTAQIRVNMLFKKQKRMQNWGVNYDLNTWYGITKESIKRFLSSLNANV